MLAGFRGPRITIIKISQWPLDNLYNLIACYKNMVFKPAGMTYVSLLEIFAYSENILFKMRADR